MEYIIGDLPAFYWNEAYKISKNNEIRNVFLLYYKNEIPLLGSSSLGSPLLEEKTYPEKEFQQILSYIRKAGENLQRINQKLKLEQWKGKEEFII